MHATPSDCGSRVPDRAEKKEGTRNRRTADRHPGGSLARRLAIFAVLSVVTLASLLVGRGDAPAAQAAPTPNGYALVQDVTTANIGSMVDFALIPGKPDEAVVVTQGGVVWRVSLTGAFARTEFGNLSGLVRSSSEEGLLSLAFSPNFTGDSRVYVYYTPLATRCAPITRCSRIARMPVVNNDMVEASETVVLDIDQEIAQSNHNGGRLLFADDVELLHPMIHHGLVAEDERANGHVPADRVAQQGQVIDRVGLFRACYRALKRSGVLLNLDFAYPDTLAEFREPLFWSGVDNQYREMSWGTVHPTWQEQQQMLTGAGFAAIERHFVRHIPQGPHYLAVAYKR